MHREPADGWPDNPLTERQARRLLEEDIVSVWVMDYGENTRDLVLDEDSSDDVVLDVVLETDDGYEMYSYTDYEGEQTWVSFGTEPKGTDGGDAMQETLESYRLLATSEDG